MAHSSRSRLSDESRRFGLGSFKALGGAYAAFHLAQRHLERSRGHVVDTALLFAGGFARDLKSVVLCCATDGNHGRAVAWAAQRLGCSCIIFLHENVSDGRETALRDLGAEVVRMPGTYDDSVAEAAKRATAHGWWLISDTSYAGYTDIPVLVMEDIASWCRNASIRNPISSNSRTSSCRAASAVWLPQ